MLLKGYLPLLLFVNLGSGLAIAARSIVEPIKLLSTSEEGCSVDDDFSFFSAGCNQWNREGI